MLEYIVARIRAIEVALPPDADRAEALQALRQLGLSDFGELMISMPDPRFPKLSALLPRMASADVQKSWTGNSGMTLLEQTVDFVRAAAYGYTDATGKPLRDATILDFGCGYGRMIRMMYHFADPAKVYGVDPWSRSIEICREDGLDRNMAVSEYLPDDLPVGDVRFDFMFAFSVFTHLSERATRKGLEAMRGHLAEDGVMLITIRPVEYWDVDPIARSQNASARYQEAHRKVGFAFQAHSREAVDGDVTYGDTSMTLAWLAEAAPDLRIIGTDRSLADPMQLYVFMRHR